MHMQSSTINTAPRFQVSQNVAHATMSSLELLELVNLARVEYGEKEVRHNDFAARCRDELDGEYYETFVVRNSRGPASEALRMSADQCKLVAMRESKAVRRKVLTRLNELEAGLRSVPAATKLAGELAIAECYSRMLKPAPSSQAAMLAKIARINGLSTEFLPAYAVDAASDSTDGSSMPTKALTALLREHGIALKVPAFNQLLKAHGYLKRMTRQNSKRETVEFWSVTDKGLAFGKNLTSPSNPRETQPHWYVERFAELVRLVGGAQ